MKTCEEDGCDARMLARGKCNKHYLRWRDAGGKTNPRGRLWTAEEDALLMACAITPWDERLAVAGGGPMRELADQLGRTVTALRCRRERIEKKAGRRGQWTRKGLWTAEEDERLRLLIPPRGEPVSGDAIEDTAIVIGRTYGATRLRLYRMRRRLQAE